MAIAKYGGRDCELSTTGQDREGQSIDPWDVTRAVLDQIDVAVEQFGGSVWSHAGGTSGYGGYGGSGGYGGYGGSGGSGDYGGWGYSGSALSSDCRRHWTDAGQCFYSDMAHVEVCTASCLDPYEFAAQCLGTVLVAEAARDEAEAVADDGTSYSLTTSNADILNPAISFGTHLSMQIAKPLWENLVEDQQRPATLGYVASAMACAVPFFGAGYLLPLRDGTVVYSLSGRAHHLRKMCTVSTTQAFGRGLLNGRREAHGEDHERLHLIAFDFDVLSSALLFSFMQTMLAAAEEGCAGPILVTPLRALRTWSWQLEGTEHRLSKTALGIDGRRWTMPALMRRLCEDLLKMIDAGLIDETVAPHGRELLQHVLALADHAAAGRIGDCAVHLGWASKLMWLTQLFGRDMARWTDPAARVADHDFVSSCPDRGAFWKLWDAGAVDPLCTLDDARRSLQAAPEQSRDWGRSEILRRFHGYVDAMDWSYITLRTGAGRWSRRIRIDLPHLDSLNKAAFQDVVDGATDPENLYDRLTDCQQATLRENHPLDDPTNQLAVIPTNSNRKEPNNE